MVQENLQINIGANTQDLQQGLNQATGAVNNFSASLNRASKPTADATQSLTNLSRIAQDAPYGFIGISNNLNPMLESFQRLQKETGSSGEALKAMVAGLTGPAGIGVALGVVSSLLVVFGKDITEFFQELASAGSVTKEMKTSLEGIGSEFTTAAEKVEKVDIAFKEYHDKIITGNEALKIYNETLGKNFGIKSDINEAEKVFKDKTAAYIEASLQRALADQASKKAAEELLKQEVLKKEGPQTKLTDYFLLTNIEGSAASNAKQRNFDQINESEKIITRYREIALQAKEVSDLYVKGFDLNLTPEKQKREAKPKEDNYGDELVKEMRRAREFYTEYKELIKNFNGGEIIPLDTPDKLRKDEQKRLASIKPLIDNLKKEMEQTGLGAMLGQKAEELGEKFKAQDAEAKERSKNLEKQEQQYKSFARTLSNDVTNALFGMYDAMQKGQNPLRALGDFLTDITKKFAAAIIQATIFKGLMALMNTFTGGGGLLGSIFGGVGKLLGFADGGIVSSPTMAMVGEGGQSEAIMPLSKLGNMMNSTFAAGAMSGNNVGSGNGQFVLKGNDLVLALQRSNYSLNLRRGA